MGDRISHLTDSTFHHVVHDSDRPVVVGFGCDEAFRAFDAWAGDQLSGQDARALLPEVARHLELCPECADDFEALLARLRKISARNTPR